MYEVGITAGVRARHVMPGMDGPEGRPHAHDYRIEVVVARGELDEQGMVCDIDRLEAALSDVLDRVRDRDLEEIKPSDAYAVTVEVLARWAHGEIAEALQGVSGELLVRAWESPVAFGGYAAPLSSA
jgi:6-pyruvoyltetrahydropterin/6-carboxytetrahydropterin synthase